ncbi:hypothetical protein EDB89DRAFT_2084468 [Lactarius sanguifluus]|nr:hypothetical protein EDB89DRAFT_2084468 [Lactarius sanguifluus]
MSTLFDDCDDKALLNFDNINDEDNEVFWSCAPSAAFSATTSTRSLGMPSSLLSQPLGLPIQTIARLTHNELTHNPEFMKYVDMLLRIPTADATDRGPEEPPSRAETPDGLDAASGTLRSARETFRRGLDS